MAKWRGHIGSKRPCHTCCSDCHAIFIHPGGLRAPVFVHQHHLHIFSLVASVRYVGQHSLKALHAHA